MPEDRAKLQALWAWRGEHCPECHQRRSEWLDPATGEELKDPPFEVAEALCPACAALEYHQEETPKSQRRKGAHPYFRRLDDTE